MESGNFNDLLIADDLAHSYIIEGPFLPTPPSYIGARDKTHQK